MAYYVQLDDDVVTAINVTDTVVSEGWLAAPSEPKMGWIKQPDDSYAAPTPSTPVTKYQYLDVIQYEALVEAVSHMTRAEYVAWEADTNALAIYTRTKLAKVRGFIDINRPEFLAMVEKGLDVMANLGHTGQLTAQNFKSTIMAAWPTE